MSSASALPPNSGHEPHFRERRAVPWWWWVVALTFAIPSVEAVAVLGPEMTGKATWLAASIALVATILAVAAALLTLSRSDVVVDAGGLHAGARVLQPSAMGRVRVLNREAARALLGRDARADAYLSIKPWVHTAVQIEVVGPQGIVRPPYWVVASRRPNELADALATLGSVTRGHVPTIEDFSTTP